MNTDEIGQSGIVYRASELGGCVKKQAALRMGYEPIVKIPDSIQRVFDAGNEAEDVVVAYYQEQLSISIYDRQMEVMLPPINTINGPVVILGHIDGLRDYLLSIGVLVEIKSMGKYEFEQFKKTLWDTPGLIQRYKWQLSVYMNALGKQCTFIAWNRDSNPDNPEYLEIVLEKPFYTFQDIYERVVEIENIAYEGVLPTECSSQDYPCAVFYLHADPAEYISDDAKREVVEGLAAAYLGFADSESKAKGEKKKIRDKILKELGSDVQKVSAGEGVVISVYEFAPGGDRYDIEKMKEDGVEVDKYKIEGKKVPAVRVTGPKDSKRKNEVE